MFVTLSFPAPHSLRRSAASFMLPDLTSNTENDVQNHYNNTEIDKIADEKVEKTMAPSSDTEVGVNDTDQETTTDEVNH